MRLLTDQEAGWTAGACVGSACTPVPAMVLFPSQMTAGGGCSSGQSTLRAFTDVSPEFSVGAAPIAIPVETLAKGPPPGGATIHMHHLYAAIQF